MEKLGSSPHSTQNQGERLGSPWTASVLTLFPNMFPGTLGESLAGSALNSGLWDLEINDIREFATDKHKSVDDLPFGGGPGMVLRADILAKSVDAACASAKNGTPLIYLSPRGRLFDQKLAKSLALGPGVILICGRFEGIDERLLKARQIEEVSIGDFILSGGEPAAIALIDSAVRLLPGVVRDPRSVIEDSFENGLLEYPQYTRPQNWEGHEVPGVLLSGHHKKISEWRLNQAEQTTKLRRPDLWTHYIGARNSKRGKKL